MTVAQPIDPRTRVGNAILDSIGIKDRLGGTHAARTMMFTELYALVRYCGSTPKPREAYRLAVIDHNCLAKRSAKSRSLTFRHLVDLYGLEDTQLVFVSLLHFWQRDPESGPMLALCAALARDGWLARLADRIFRLEVGTEVSRMAIEEQIEQLAPERLSDATRKSLAQNINSTFTQSGHLKGRSRKHRTRAKATPTTAAYALLISYASGARGPALFETVYTKSLDCSREEAMAMAEAASRRGLMRFNRVGDVMEVAFPDIVSRADLERIHEQN
ncbi:hypothetical protein GJ672_05645 [Spiribacter sp. 2438]|uniref:hypothetical protein n=1 Tax=Spiribacter sp. 2438 TaxID=2666185 RepID=UPI0012B12A11|nr:hypothetical protein [Spiribacter sp. 2438]QGM21794.1 hypothetical protein GJ672_05645 [Spiribacter sp. 2438]